MMHAQSKVACASQFSHAQANFECTSESRMRTRKSHAQSKVACASESRMRKRIFLMRHAQSKVACAKELSHAQANFRMLKRIFAFASEFSHAQAKVACTSGFFLMMRTQANIHAHADFRMGKRIFMLSKKSAKASEQKKRKFRKIEIQMFFHLGPLSDGNVYVYFLSL